VALGSGPICILGDLPSNLHYDALASAYRSPTSCCRSKNSNAGDPACAAEREETNLPRAFVGSGKTTLYRKLKQYDAESQSAPS